MRCSSGGTISSRMRASGLPFSKGWCLIFWKCLLLMSLAPSAIQSWTQLGLNPQTKIKHKPHAKPVRNQECSVWCSLSREQNLHNMGKHAGRNQNPSPAKWELWRKKFNIWFYFSTNAYPSSGHLSACSQGCPAPIHPAEPWCSHTAPELLVQLEVSGAC